MMDPMPEHTERVVEAVMRQAEEAEHHISQGAANLIYATLALVATVWILIEVWNRNNKKGRR